MKPFRCTVCGYVHTGDTPPAFCPQCKAPAAKFTVVTGESRPYPAEHVLGVAAGVDPAILEGLRMNFNGECTEVGMYLAMSRARPPRTHSAGTPPQFPGSPRARPHATIYKTF